MVPVGVVMIRIALTEASFVWDGLTYIVVSVELACLKLLMLPLGGFAVKKSPTMSPKPVWFVRSEKFQFPKSGCGVNLGMSSAGSLVTYSIHFECL